MTELEAVREANESFYAALEGHDLARMSGLWLHEDWVHCVHPGGEALRGWETVHTSWRQIFERGGWMRVTPTGVEIRIEGDVAVVVCSENITAEYQSEVRVAVALATNLYRRTPAGWRMVHHHASPASVNVTQPFSGTIQ